MSIFVCIPPLDIWCGVSDSPTCAAAVAAVIQPHTKPRHQKCRKEEEPSELILFFFFSISQKKKKKEYRLSKRLSHRFDSQRQHKIHTHTSRDSPFHYAFDSLRTNIFFFFLICTSP